MVRDLHSGIERRIKEALIARTEVDTAISWVGAHIGIPRNTKADMTALPYSHIGWISSPYGLATEVGTQSRTMPPRYFPLHHQLA